MLLLLYYVRGVILNEKSLAFHKKRSRIIITLNRQVSPEQCLCASEKKHV